MVLTRNQKRSCDIEQEEFDEENNSEHEHKYKKIKLDHNNTSIYKLIKKDNKKFGESENQSEIKETFSEIESESAIETSSETSSASETSSEIEIIEPNKTNLIKGIIDYIYKKNKHIESKVEIEESEDEDENEDGNEDENENEDENATFENEYKKYIKYIDSIYDGDFFLRKSLDDKKNKLKNIYNKDEIKNINKELKKIKENYKKSSPNIIDILKLDVDTCQKQKLLEHVYHYANSELLSNEYTNNLNYINKNIKGYETKELYDLEKKILEESNNIDLNDNYRERILKSKMSFENKIIAYKRLEVMESFENSDTSEYAKYKSWMDTLLSIPFEKYNKKDYCIKNIRNVLDKRLSFLEKPKDQIINIVTHMIRNPQLSINAIGLYGPKGTGKSSIIKSISEALNRPYRTISLGGESESSLLTGHGFTYVGSCPGRIIEILRETKCMNPIILFDELDKVSETNHGKEIIGNLIHLTDSTTNTTYNYDKYFAGLEFDLSKVLFVFTYNDPSKVDKILADRLYKIHINNYSFKEKLEITTKHLIKTTLSEYHFDTADIIFEDETINYIVETSKTDQGMRDIKRKFEIIISRINTLLLTDENDQIVKLKYKMLYEYYKQYSIENKINLPIKIPKAHVDIFLTDAIESDEKIKDPPFGMYI